MKKTFKKSVLMLIVAILVLYVSVANINIVNATENNSAPVFVESRSIHQCMLNIKQVMYLQEN